MDPQENSLINSYRLVVTETYDHQVVEWSGSLTISASGVSSSFIDITFSEQPLVRCIQKEDASSTGEGISIECQAV